MIPHLPANPPLITRLPYTPNLGETLRGRAVATSRPVWLRLAGGTQELFACWPEQVICVCGRKLEHVTAAGVRLFAGDADALWTLLRKGLQTLPPLPGLPFAGGWLGVIGYGAGGLSQNEGPRLPFPDVLLGDYRRFVFIDHVRQCAELVTLSGYSGPPDDRLVDGIKCERDHVSAPFRLTAPFQALTPKTRYLTDIGRIQDWLQAGDCYQVNYAQAFRARCQGSGAIAMAQLLALSRAPHAAWMLAPEGEVLSLSPELFLSVRNGHIVTKPIKGTAPRAVDPAIDQQQRDALTNSDKNRAENLMIVDLLRHDLGQHAATGSVTVDKLFAVESLPQVHHLVSTISAKMAAGTDVIDVIRDCFPGGSITGAPKKRAMEIIAELEPTPRSVYCGSIGFIGANGDAELNIAIRTLLRIGEDLYAWAGGGIVADSDAEAEYQECFDKMGALMRALETGN